MAKLPDMWGWHNGNSPKGLQDMLRFAEANRKAILSLEVTYDPDLVEPVRVDPDLPFNYYGIAYPDFEI